MFGTFATGLRQPLIVTLTGKEEFAEASGFMQEMSQTISILAQFVGASSLLILTYEKLAFFNKNKELAFKRSEPSTKQQANFTKNIRQSLKILRQEAHLFTVILPIIFLNAMLSSLTPIHQMLLVENKQMILSSYSFTIATLNATIAVALALGGFLGTNYLKRFSLQTLLFSCLLATSIFYPLVLTHNIYLILLTIIPICFLVGAIMPRLSGWIVQIVAADKLAMTIGLINSLLVGLAPLSTFLIVLLASLTAPTYAIFLLFALGLALIFGKIMTAKK